MSVASLLSVYNGRTGGLSRVYGSLPRSARAAIDGIDSIAGLRHAYKRAYAEAQQKQTRLAWDRARYILDNIRILELAGETA